MLYISISILFIQMLFIIISMITTKISNVKSMATFTITFIIFTIFVFIPVKKTMNTYSSLCQDKLNGDSTVIINDHKYSFNTKIPPNVDLYLIDNINIYDGVIIKKVLFYDDSINDYNYSK